MVYTCSYCKRKCVKGIGCYSFPKDKKLCDQWLVACNFDLHPKNNTLKLKLCSRHFENSCFLLKDNGRKLLKRNAIPTILYDNKVKPNNRHFPVISNDFHNTLKLKSEDIILKCEIDEVKIEMCMEDNNFTKQTPDAFAVVKCEPENDDYEVTPNYATEPISQHNIKIEYDIDKVKVEDFTENSYHFPAKSDHTYAVIGKKPEHDTAEYTVTSLDFPAIEPCDINVKIKEECEI
ncbi:hypothetical protein AMK59_1726 [Oryctes borbonicus]|uniref:THAP-type domain-containing protein n=1 Tax=Oryctes borbonicus TaxID=1629725 RepID=A0A0T6BAY7_9SCAR|nr:hypothetical protein AMK59_1726 [Oryctes borbonicus]